MALAPGIYQSHPCEPDYLAYGQVRGRRLFQQARQSACRRAEPPDHSEERLGVDGCGASRRRSRITRRYRGQWAKSHRLSSSCFMDRDDVAVCGGKVEGISQFAGRIGMNGAKWLLQCLSTTTPDGQLGLSATSVIADVSARISLWMRGRAAQAVRNEDR